MGSAHKKGHQLARIMLARRNTLHLLRKQLLEHLRLHILLMTHAHRWWHLVWPVQLLSAEAGTTTHSLAETLSTEAKHLVLRSPSRPAS